MGKETKRKAELSKAERICEEKRRLEKFYKNIDGNKKGTVEGLLQRAAYMRVCLEIFEKDLDEKGFVEPFSQSEAQAPYDRKRPVADLYNTMNASYQKIIKQLTDLLPKEEIKPEEDDGFEAFINGRDE